MRWTAILLVVLMWGCSPPNRSLEGLPCDNGECIDGWVCYEKTDTCIPANSPCDPDPCDHGVCSADGSCTCDDGWSGDACDVPADPCDPDPCADAHKICVADNGSASCGDCVAGYHDEGGDCLADTTCQPTTCSDHGTCDDVSGSPVCTCDSEYSGDHCEACADGYHWNADGTACTSDPCDPNPCTDLHKGECADEGSQAVCSCDSGYHLEGDDCIIDQTCNGRATCNDHGDCDDSSGAIVCTCDTGYTGDTCDACDTGYQDNDTNGTCEETCITSGLACGDNGDCDDSSGTSACTCDTGWAGALCDTCDTGYIGADCHRDWCIDNGDSCNHGSCLNEACDCDTGWTGTFCDRCAQDYHDENGECVPDWPYLSRLVITLTAGKSPFIQNGGESDVLFFSITAENGPAGISAMTVEVDCPNGQVSEVADEGTIYRSADGQTYEPISIPGQGAVTRYIADSNFIRSGYIQEELFAEGETKHYKFSPVVSSLSSGEECTVTYQVDAQTVQDYLYHDVETSILANPDGVCHERPPFFIWSDLSAGVDHLRPTVDFWPCTLLEGAEPQPWGSDDFIQGAMDASAITVTLTAP